MTPDKQRTAIAEACGWKKDLTSPMWVRGKDGMSRLPNYLTDLNAMHEAEKALSETQQRDYAFLLNDLDAHRLPGNYLGRNFDVLHATAAQRAEAFLRTIEKWEDL